MYAIIDRNPYIEIVNVYEKLPHLEMVNHCISDDEPPLECEEWVGGGKEEQFVETGLETYLKTQVKSCGMLEGGLSGLYDRRG